MEIRKKSPWLSLDDPWIKLISWTLIILAVFLFGYYLRAYFPLHKALPFSPYDAFYEANLFQDQLHKNLDLFSAKALNYPVGYYLSLWLRTFFPSIYLTYIAGSILLFFIGKKISGKNLGGILAFFGYAVASENLIQYSGSAYPSGLCYIFIFGALLWLLKYLESNKKSHLFVFCLLAVLALASYHTGAAAFLSILLGLLISAVFSLKNIDKKFLVAFLLLAVYHILTVLTVDFRQIQLISNALKNINWLFILPVLILLALIFPLTLMGLKKIKWLESEYLPLIVLAPATFLIFTKIDIFSPLLGLGVDYYYSSAITLNNYLAQALLLHVYFILMLPKFYAPTDDKKIIFIRGWIIGLVIISAGLVMEKYFARILDYTFPLAFVLFGWYWSEKIRFRKTVITATLLLLITSQLMIYHDPFSMRRYYNQNEIDSAKKIMAMNLGGIMVSDLRTTALFNYLGDKNAKLPPQYKMLFYRFEKFLGSNLATAAFSQPYRPSHIPDYYLVLSQSMKTVMYSTNFETDPLTDKIFNYYDGRFKKIYDDGLIRVYQIHEKQYR